MTRIAPSLRQDHRALTRQRIVDAARQVFARRGYGAATIDEILQVAGISRSTLYVYFRDKEGILTQIAEDFTEGYVEVARDIRGPAPSREEIDRWMGKMADFMAQERVPTALLAGLSSSSEAPLTVHRKMGMDILKILAVELPAFRRAVEDGPDQPLAHVWATLVMREVASACRHFGLEPASETNRCLMQVASELFHRFASEHR